MSVQFKAALTKKLKANNLSVAEFEKMAGLSRNSIQHILNGHTKRPDINTLVSIAKTLHCSIDELVSENNLDNAPNLSTKTIKQKKIFKIEDFGLLNEIEQFIINYLTINHIYPYSEPYFEAVKEIYSYCISGEEKKFDKRFAEWVLSNRL